MVGLWWVLGGGDGFWVRCGSRLVPAYWVSWFFLVFFGYGLKRALSSVLMY